MPDNLPAARVVDVVDGDTLVVQQNGQEARVRLIGLDTPESVHPNRPVECFGREASAQLKDLVEGQRVRLEADATQNDADRYGRLLRYVWLPDGHLVNQTMIAQGYGFEYTYRTPYIYQEQFKQAEREAREQQRGLWSDTTCGGEQRPADATAAPKQPPPTSAPECDPAYPDVCIPSPPPDLDCGDVEYRRFRVLPPDPHNFDGNGDGVACER
jgi:micrococcal nuclease